MNISLYYCCNVRMVIVIRIVFFEINYTENNA